MIIKVAAHELILSFSCLLEYLQNYSNEKPDEDCGDYNGIAEEVYLGDKLVSATYGIFIILDIIFKCRGILALILRTVLSAQCFHYFRPLLSSNDSDQGKKSCSEIFKISIFV